jgi:hypothetical protein
MKLALTHKIICIVAIMCVIALIIIDRLISQDKSGLNLFEGDFIFSVIISTFYTFCAGAFFCGIWYVISQKNNKKLFWLFIILTITACILTVPISFEFIKSQFSPPAKGIFIDFFKMSENKKMLLWYQGLLCTLLAALQFLSIFTIIKLRKQFINVK